MFLIEKTVTFDRWLTRLRDPIAKSRILVQIKKVEAGNLGSSKALGGGLSELKIDYGPGYRLLLHAKGSNGHLAAVRRRQAIPTSRYREGTRIAVRTGASQWLRN